MSNERLNYLNIKKGNQIVSDFQQKEEKPSRGRVTTRLCFMKKIILSAFCVLTCYDYIILDIYDNFMDDL